MKIAPARTPERFRARKRPRSSTFHENLDFSKFRLHDANPMVHSSSGCASSFFDLGTPFESQKPCEHEKNYKYAKRTYRSGAFRRFVGRVNENDFRHETGQTPRGRYYSRKYRSTSRVLIQAGCRKAMKVAPARTSERFRGRKRLRSCTFHENLDFQNFDSMTPTPCYIP